MRLGIFGGSFNPIHRGHLHAAQTFARKLGLDLTLLLPSAAPFYKDTCPIAFAHRYAMCLLAVEGLPGIGVSDMERSHPNGMYTCDVVKRLKIQYPDSELFLLMGSDVFQRLPLWKGYGDIVSSAGIVVMRRNTALPLNHPEPGTIFLEDETLALSSTLARKSFATPGHYDRLDTLVPEKVAHYIRSHDLYKNCG